jgi:hypothetical protein
MPQFNTPAASIRVKEFCERWGLAYVEMSYFEAWKAMFKNLVDVGKAA